MNTKSIVITMSLLLFINCGGSSSSATSNDLDGTWIVKGGCEISGSSSDFSSKIFNGIDLTSIYKSYENTTCSESGLVSHYITKSEELVGETVIAKDTQSAISLNSTNTDNQTILSNTIDSLIDFGSFVFAPTLGVKTYGMYRINAQRELQFANNTVENNGTDSEHRRNDFTNSTIYIRQ